MTTKLQFTIPAKILKAVAAFASRDETRYILQGVCVEASKEKTLLIATNGRMAVIYNATDDIDWVKTPDVALSFVVPIHLIQKAEPDALRRVALNQWNGDGVEFVSLTGKIEMRDKTVEGHYPNWRHIIPAKEPTPMTRICINPGFLDRFSKFANAVSHSGAGVILQQRGGEFEALTIHPATALNNWIGILMPLRGESFTNPTWI